MRVSPTLRRGCVLATELQMPQMGYDMQEGTVVRWLISEGAEVKLGEAIAEIETDKAVVEFESTASGLLRKILVSEGSTVPVGQTIGIVGEEGEELPEIATEEPAAPEAPDAVAVLPPPTHVEEPLPAPAGEVRASPVARRLAEERGIDLTQVTGTGPGGRITKNDVLTLDASRPAAEAVPARPFEAKSPAAAPSEPVAGELVPLSRMRQQIARVTVRSKTEIPHFYVSAEVDVTEAMELRQRINQSLEDQGIRVSVNDLIIKACVGALKAYPRFNAYFAEDAIQMNEQINVGIAIAEEEGLIVPAIMDCGGKSLADIARASKDLIERSKSGTLHPQEYTGGTFSISNLGMYDVSSFVAIIHPPQSAVLAVGAVRDTAVVSDGAVAIAKIMTATLSADHRVTDGAEGARFVLEVKRLLERPLSMIV